MKGIVGKRYGFHNSKHYIESRTQKGKYVYNFTFGSGSVWYDVETENAIIKHFKPFDEVEVIVKGKINNKKIIAQEIRNANAVLEDYYC